ncbi:MAG: aldo/keto reductase [Anaerolineae bacterium]
MSAPPLLPPIHIGRSSKFHAPLGMGGSFYGLDHQQQQGEADIVAAHEAALENGITHFDTATGYGSGYSERLLGRFINAIPDRRDRLFIASKANLDVITASAIINAIDASRERLQTDYIDLYYLHWPRTGQDMRPWMEGLETARQQGKIRAIGVSNFTVTQMEQLATVGTIDAYQLGYNLLWRFDEKDVIPYCEKHHIALVVYSALAHGILSGKYARQLDFVPGDQRWTISLFKNDVWPQVYEIVEGFKQVAKSNNYSLAHLALRWLLRQPAVKSVLVSAKNRQQLLDNVQALNLRIPYAPLDELTILSDRAMQIIPDEGNPFGYHP